MEMLNHAIAEADAFKKMMETVQAPPQSKEPKAEAAGEGRRERRAREREEAKAAKRAAKASA